MITPRQLEILQHALGADEYGQGGGHRNRFCAGAAGEPDCRALVEMGLMAVFHPNKSPLPYYNVAVTDVGKTAMLMSSPPPPKLSRSQRRYREWARSESGESFGEFLRRRSQEEKNGRKLMQRANLTEKQMALGRAAYEGYRSSSGGKSLISGDPLPPFERLKPVVQLAWVVGAEAAVETAQAREAREEA